MKKTIITTLLLSGVMLCSCEKPVQQEAPKELTPDDQKLKIERVTDEFMQHHDATSFSPIINLFNDCVSKYIDQNYDFGNLGDAFSEAEILEYSSDDIGEFTRMSYLLSTLKGDLDMTGETGIFTASDKDMEAHFSIGADTYHLKFSCSGAFKKQNLGMITSHIVYDTHCDIDRREFIIEMPEKLVIDIKKGSSDYASIELVTDADFTETGIDYANDHCSVTVKITLPNNYTMLIHPAEIDMKTHKGNLNFDLMQNEKNILSLQATADVNFEVTDVDCGCDMGHQITKVVFDYAHNLEISTDILEEIQVKASLKDIESLTNLKKVAIGEEKAAAERFNRDAEIGLYYDHNDIKKADLLLDTFKVSPDSTEEDYRLMLVFTDESQYLLDEYWTDDELQEFIDFGESFVKLFQSIRLING